MKNQEKSIEAKEMPKLKEGKKERKFYLDFIRALSMIIIVTYHFAVHFATETVPMHFFVSGKWGLLGVALFFMISGASLMYNYDEKINLKKYYKKRFLGIYPTFWITYSLGFLYLFWKHKGFFVGEPIYKLIFSFLGMDGYLLTYVSSFYFNIGDWFLGCIILVYLLFPLLQFAIRKFPKILISIATIIYVLIIYKSNFKMPMNQNLFVSVYSFLMGMYFAIYIKDIKIWHVIPTMIISLYILVMFERMASGLENATFIANLAAYCLFFGLCWLGQKINIQFIKNITNLISKYSYIIFLLQHCVILEIREYFSNAVLDKYGMICMYLICWFVILALGKFIYILNKKILELFKSEKQEG